MNMTSAGGGEVVEVNYNYNNIIYLDPFYIVRYYIKMGQDFLDIQYASNYSGG